MVLSLLALLTNNFKFNLIFNRNQQSLLATTVTLLNSIIQNECKSIPSQELKNVVYLYFKIKRIELSYQSNT